MDEFRSLESLSPRELHGVRPVELISGDEHSIVVYAANHFCKACQKQKLSIYHGFDVCMTCIVRVARTFNPKIETFDEILSKTLSDVRWKVWRKLNIRKRRPV